MMNGFDNGGFMNEPPATEEVQASAMESEVYVDGKLQVDKQGSAKKSNKKGKKKKKKQEIDYFGEFCGCLRSNFKIINQKQNILLKYFNRTMGYKTD